MRRIVQCISMLTFMKNKMSITTTYIILLQNIISFPIKFLTLHSFLTFFFFHFFLQNVQLKKRRKRKLNKKEFCLRPSKF